ncbi:MAG: right-handed parallel beta-helix repeat-containing protein [Lachnospiraceae bacterium]|nr:right-handed parallel beta-helix repeat-containing protein [Lachnospiraceae bacterium]
MKKRIIMLAAAVAATAGLSAFAAGEVKAAGGQKLFVEVETVGEMMGAIDDGVTVVLAPGMYDLTEWLEEDADLEKWEEGTDEKGIYAGDAYEGPELHIVGYRDLTIVSRDSDDPAEVVCVPGHANVLNFEYCSNIHLDGLSLGHYPEAGECIGSVLFVGSSDHITVSDCELYGCGVYALVSDYSDHITFTGCDVHSCSDGIVSASASEDLLFIDTDFHDCTGFTNFNLDGSSCSIIGCSMENLSGTLADTDDLNLSGNTFEKCFEEYPGSDQIDVPDPEKPAEPEKSAEPEKPSEPEKPGDMKPEKPADNKTDRKDASEFIPLYWANDYYYPEGEENQIEQGYYSTSADLYFVPEDEYPELSETLKQLNWENSMTASMLLDGLKKSIDENYEPEEDEWRSFSYDLSRFLNRADKKVLSFTEYNDLTGFDEGQISEARGINLDPETGENIDLLDVVSSADDFLAAVENEIEENDFYVDEWKEEALPLTEDFLDQDEVTGDIAGLSFTIDYQGITLIFNGSLTGFDDGPCTIFVAYDEYPEVFNEEYTDVPDNYIAQLATGNDIENLYWYDFDADGEVEPVSVTLTPMDDSDDNYIVSARWDEEVFELEETEYCYEADAYLVHFDDKDYMYVVAGYEDAYRDLNVYEINSEAWVYVDSVTGTPGFMMQYPYEKSDEIPGYIPVDPESFKIMYWTDCLGTNQLMGDYTVSEDGMPKLIGDGYEFIPEDYWDIKAVKDIEAESTKKDPAEWDYESDTLKKGTAVIPYRYYEDDGILILEAEDGTYYRLDIDVEDYEWSIDGESPDDLFDGLIYAG